MEDKFLTIKKTAEILGVSTLTLRNWDKGGKFKALRHPINNYRVYKVGDVLNLMKEIKDTASIREKKETDKKKVRKLDIKHLKDSDF